MIKIRFHYPPKLMIDLELPAVPRAGDTIRFAEIPDDAVSPGGYVRHQYHVKEVEWNSGADSFQVYVILR